jgi:molybdate transport system substrate-binding protein
MKKRIASSLLLAIALAFSAFAAGNEIVVSAAASLTDVLNGLKPAAEKAIGATISFNFGGSGALRKQIEQGAPADVFFSAAASDMDALDKAGLLAPKTKLDLLSNAIVLVGGAPAGGASKDAKLPEVKTTADLKALLTGAKLFAIGNPDAVPAGRYAVQALKALDLYSIVEKKLVLGGNVREVLQFVQTGSAPYGVVFLTDAMTVKPESGVKILYQFAANLSSPVIYPVAVVGASKNADKAAAFIAFLQTPVAKEAFKKAGFVVQ